MNALCEEMPPAWKCPLVTAGDHVTHSGAAQEFRWKISQTNNSVPEAPRLIKTIVSTSLD